MKACSESIAGRLQIILVEMSCNFLEQIVEDAKC